MTESCIAVFYDVNGDSKPDEPGRDIHRFYICGGDFAEGIDAFDVAPNVTTPQTNFSTRDLTLQSCKDEPYYGGCTRLLKLDGWEYKSDYPHNVN